MKHPVVINKLLNSYLDSRIIYLFDLFLTVLASAVTLMALYAVTGMVHLSNSEMIVWMLSSTLISASVMLVFRTYRVVIRHSTLRDLARLSAQLMAKEGLFAVVVFSNLGFTRAWIVALCCDFLLALFLLLALRMLLIFFYDILRRRTNDFERRRVLVYGTGDKVAAVLTRFKNSRHLNVVGVLTDNNGLINTSINEVSIHKFSNEDSFVKVYTHLRADAVLFASEGDAKKESERLLQYCVKNNVKTLVVPDFDEVKDGRVLHSKVREIRIEDLLGRDEIKISLDEIKDSLKGKVVLVTGAAGSIGSELCRQLSNLGIKKLVLYDNAETPMHNVRLEFEARFPELDFSPVIGDVRNLPRLDYVFRKFHPQVVFHAAAYKHVPLMEENPCEAVLVNVLGTKHVADKCIEYNAEKMVMISTDKAVNPTNIMGCTKRLAEIYVQSLGLAIANGQKEGSTKFVTTRFGNVLGSNGSVIPRFREQIEAGGPVTVTDPRIIRFFMTIPEACRLVMEAATISKGNQICVFDMGSPVKIDTLARKMIQLAGFVPDKDIHVVYTGLRPGEKLFEEVLATDEGTEPTSHDRIRIAKVRDYDYQEVVNKYEELVEYALSVSIPEMVILMKKIVPEFKSKNSRFELYD